MSGVFLRSDLRRPLRNHVAECAGTVTGTELGSENEVRLPWGAIERFLQLRPARYPEQLVGFLLANFDAVAVVLTPLHRGHIPCPLAGVEQ